MSTEDTTRDGGREVASADQSAQHREQQAHDPNRITDADRAANPFGTARREREIHRGEGGRFAEKPNGKDGPEGQDGGDEPSDGQNRDQQQNGRVPQAALRAERGKRQEAVDENAVLRRQVAELNGRLEGFMRGQQPPQQRQQAEAPPEFWADPQARVAHEVRQAMSPMQQALEQQRIGTSRMMAVQTYGPERVDAAVRALTEFARANPSDFRRLEAMAEQSFDPIGDVVRWHSNITALQKYGSDPETFIKAEVERRLAEMQQGGEHFEQHAPPSSRRPPQPQHLPSSFAAAPSGGARGSNGGGGARTIQELLGR